MLVGLAVNTGIREESLLLCLAALTLTTMQLGLMTEVYSRLTETEVPHSPSWQTKSALKRLLPHILGWFPFLTVWFVVVRSFAQNVNDTRAQNDTDRDIPPGILAMLVGTLVLYACFAPVQIIYQVRDPKFYWQSEVVYLVLSLVSKVYLGITLMINVVLIDDA